MLNDILTLNQLQWLPNRLNFPQIAWPWYWAWPSLNYAWFHGTFATGMAWKQGAYILHDTWFRPPFWGLDYAIIVEISLSVCPFTTLTLYSPRYFLDFAYNPRSPVVHLFSSIVIVTSRFFSICCSKIEMRMYKRYYKQRMNQRTQ